MSDMSDYKWEITDGVRQLQIELEAIVFQSKEILAKIIQPPEILPESDLPPRQLEILQIVRDHPYCSFDIIHRRFPGVSPSTLRYDVTQLTQSKFIKKIRKTRGAMYVAQLAPAPGE